jgi:hypothetical protein
MRQIRFLSALTNSKSKSFPLRVFVLLFTIGIFLIPQPVSAIVLSELMSVIAGGLAYFLGVIIIAFVGIINWLVNPDTWGPVFTQNEVIINAWRVVRDFVNLGFVLAIVVIAIGFILRLQTYGSQKTLVRLIAAAILVNFSLTIAGVFIDASTIVTRFLLTGARLTPDDQGFLHVGDRLYEATGAHQLFSPREGNPVPLIGAKLLYTGIGAVVGLIGTVLGWQRVLTDVEQATNILANTLVVSIFGVVLIATLAALIIMLVLRIAHLWVLLVLSPLAWFSWIFPQFEDNWQRWWKEFLRWTFFAPIVIFFLVLAMVVLAPPADPRAQQEHFLARGQQEIQQVMERANPPQPNQERLNPTDFATRFVISIAMIILGMTIANQMGINFADKGVAWASSAGKWPGLTAWRTTKGFGKDQFSRSSWGKSIEKYAARTRFLGGTADQIKKWRDESDAKIDKQKQRMIDAKLSVQEIEKFSRKRSLPMEQRTAAVLAAAAHKEFAKLPEEDQRRILAIAQSHSRKSAMEVLAANPLLAEHWDNTYGKTEGKVGGIEGVVRRLKADDIEKLANNAAALGNTEVIKALLGRKDHLERLAEKVSEDNMSMLRQTFATLRQALVSKAPGYDQVVHDEFDKLARINYFNLAFNLGGPTRKSNRRFQVAGQTVTQGSKPQGPAIIVPTDISSTRRESVSGGKLPRQEPPTTEPPASEPPKA